jgi:ABC-2 type transport system ATP-binding protein
MSAVIETDALTVKFGNFTAVDHVSIRVERGEVFGFLGPNGSGKTTLIKALCGLVRITSGQGKLFGLDVVRNTAEIKQRVGYMSQKFGLYEDLTVRENLDFYGGLYGLAGAALEKRKDVVIELTQLQPYLQRRASQLSGGWKQRLALACSIIHSPEVVFLDEPTAGIDPVARRALWDLLFKLSSEGVTFFVTTHYMDEAERCGRVGYIYLSRLIALGTIRELSHLAEANPPGTERIEIHGDQAASLLAWMRRQPGVLEATLFGRAVRAMVEKAHRDELEAAIVARVPGIEILKSEASLEDVFVTLTMREAAHNTLPKGKETP